MIKKILLIAFGSLLLNMASAQVMSSKTQSVTIVSANLKCWECKERLEKYLIVENKATFENGILKWTFNVARGEMKLFYNPDRITPDDIRVIFNNAGFDADSTKAEPDAYKKLPPICKRAEDGGGQKKGAPPCHIQPN